MRSQLIDAVDKFGLTLRVEFTHRGDRYGHVLSVVEPTGLVHPILESVEGTAADDWPASPPLQNLSIEPLAPGQFVALLVGMAGRHHWSASIEPVPGQAALVFDIACRVAPQSSRAVDAQHEARPALFSEYRGIDSPGKVVVGSVLDPARQPEQSQWSLILRPLGSTQNSSICPERFLLRAPASERNYGHTVRWKYAAELRPQTG